MNVVRYEPMSVLRRFHDEVNRMFNDDWAVAGNGNGDVSRVATSDWTPAVDVKEESNRFVITADVPGVEPKDIEVTMENGVLTIRGRREQVAESSKEGYRRVERVSGAFYRRFGLPDTANADGITASSNHGVLRVEIPKKDAVQPRRIEVS